jgi:hypothetical protein
MKAHDNSSTDELFYGSTRPLQSPIYPFDMGVTSAVFVLVVLASTVLVLVLQ